MSDHSRHPSEGPRPSPSTVKSLSDDMMLRFVVVDVCCHGMRAVRLRKKSASLSAWAFARTCLYIGTLLPRPSNDNSRLHARTHARAHARAHTHTHTHAPKVDREPDLGRGHPRHPGVYLPGKSIGNRQEHLGDCTPFRAGSNARQVCHERRRVRVE